MKISDMIAVGQAAQDQEIAEGVDWMTESNKAAVIAFYSAVNDGNPDTFRKFTDEEFQVLRSMAMIGFFEVGKSYCAKKGDE